MQNFFSRMASHTVPQLISEVRSQSDLAAERGRGAPGRHNFAASAQKEHSEQARLLNDRDFARINCRVVAVKENSRLTEKDKRMQSSPDSSSENGESREILKAASMQLRSDGEKQKDPLANGRVSAIGTNRGRI